MRKKTDKEFKAQVYDLVGDEYTFLEPYKDARTPIVVRHNSCGAEYKVSPDNFLRGKRCPFDGARHRKLMTDKINAQLRPYDLVLASPYQNSRTMLEVKCKKCNLTFRRLYESFDNNKKCPYCTHQRVNWNTKLFSNYVKKVTNNAYELKSSFKGVNTNVKMYHVACGHTYTVMPLNFLKGDRCPYETGQRRGKANQMSQLEFEKRMKNIWGQEIKVVGKYIAAKKPITVVHATCGKSFKTTPDSLLHHHGCPICKESNGEKAVAKYLTLHHIDFVRQKKFENCRIKHMLPFDFYLPKLNMCIEYDGEQHFHPVAYFGGSQKFKYTHYRDLFKNKFCKENQIKLIRIKYTEDVDNVLKQALS